MFRCVFWLRLSLLWCRGVKDVRKCSFLLTRASEQRRSSEPVVTTWTDHRLHCTTVHLISSLFLGPTLYRILFFFFFFYKLIWVYWFVFSLILSTNTISIYSLGNRKCVCEPVLLSTHLQKAVQTDTVVFMPYMSVNISIKLRIQCTKSHPACWKDPFF